MTKELGLLKGIGSLVGDRFWASNKNTEMVYGLLGVLCYFLSNEFKDLCTSKKEYSENQLVTSVLTLSTFSIAHKPQEQVQKAQVHISQHLRAQGVMHFAFMTDALEDSAHVVKHS
eukprot:2396175-Rhodomonas_salina.1